MRKDTILRAAGAIGGARIHGAGPDLGALEHVPDPVPGGAQPPR